MMGYKITIVGSGNAGCAHAAMLSLGGHQVTLFKTSKAGNNLNFECLRRDRSIKVTTVDGDTLTTNLYSVTDDGWEAFKSCDICFVMVQTLFHKTVAELIGRYVKHIKLLFVVPGYMGSLYFDKVLGDRVDYIAEGKDYYEP